MNRKCVSLLAIIAAILVVASGDTDIPEDVEVNENIEGSNNDKSGKLQYNNDEFYGSLDYFPDQPFGNYDYGE